MLKAWYSDRPEVEKWQKMTKRTARSQGITRTLMGRYRNLPEAQSGDRKLIGHAERASINTPIQGGAADVAMMAMIKINDSPRLKEVRACEYPGDSLYRSNALTRFARRSWAGS